VSKSDKYVPKHRAPGKHKARRAPQRALRTGVALTGLAAAAVTGVSVTGGVFSADPGALTPAAADVATTSTPELSSSQATAAASAEASKASSPTTASAELERREKTPVVSRSERRTDATKATTLSMSAGSVVTKTQNLSQADPRDIAKALLPVYGFSSDQFSCLDSLYVSESGWRVDADNPTSSAYGIPQALTGLHDMPAGYFTDAEVQIRWGLEYIQNAYGTPCNAWGFKQGHGWY
jgi:hypothetical protein